MKLEDQVCSLELAKRLKELGVKQDSYWHWSTNSGLGLNEHLYSCNQLSQYGTEGVTFASAFTVAELGNILPQLLPMEKHQHHYGRLTLWRVNDNWQLAYNLESKQCHEIDAWDKSMANTFAKMLIRLIEKGIVKP